MSLRILFLFLALAGVASAASTIHPSGTWSGATSDPGPQGDSGSPFYNAQAAGRWGTIPFQTVTNTFAVGVYAFHSEGIAKVSFAVNNGTWVDVTSTSTNASTGKQWYTVNVDGDDFIDNTLMEVRAIVYPNIGECRVLGGELNSTNLGTGEHSLYLTTNHDASLSSIERYCSPTGNDTTGDGSSGSPFLNPYKAAKSIQTAQGSNADGGIIYLMPGNYTLASPDFSNESTTEKRWLTLKPAPGYTKADVTIQGSTGSGAPGLYNKLVKFEDLTFTTATIDSGGALEDFIWVHDVSIVGLGQDVGYITAYDSSWTGRFITDSTIIESSNGATNFHIVANVDVSEVGGDCFSNSKLVLNSSDSYHDPLTQSETYHPDVYQSTGSSENVILYGITATVGITETSGLRFNNPPTCIAIIDVSIDTAAPWEMDYAHSTVYVKNSSMNIYFGGSLTAEDVVFEGVTFLGAGNPGAFSGITYRAGGNSAPVFTVHPASIAIKSGDSHSFGFTVTGTPTPTYQWRKGGVNLSGKTDATLAFTNAQLADGGSYDIVATNSEGNATSNAAVLTVGATQRLRNPPRRR